MATEQPNEQPRKPSFRRRLLTVFEIINVRLRFIVLMVIVGLIAGKWEDISNHLDRWFRPHHEAATQQAGQEMEYYCPMHPQVVRPAPGNCPICGMALSPRPKQAQQVLPEGVLARVQLTPQKMIMGRIGVSPVEHRLLSREVRAVGFVDYDETRRATISARTAGRIDKLLVNYVGQRVDKGEELALFYSPDLVVAQQELLTAVNAGKVSSTPGGQILVDAARNKLFQWGLTGKQIDAIIAGGAVQTDLAITSPIVGIVTEKKALEGQYVSAGQELYTVADLGSVWLQAKIFESEVAGIDVGQAVAVETTAYPGETFTGRIAFMSYVVDPQTRTVSARVQIDNPQYKLKPGMYAVANIRLPVGKVEELKQAATMPTTHEIAKTEGLIGPYLALAKAYAADKTDESAFTAMMAAAHEFAQVEPAGQALLAAIHSAMGKDLSAQREAFKAISTEMIHLLQARPPEGGRFTQPTARCSTETG